MKTLVLLITVALPFVITPGTSFTITVTSAAGGDRLSPVKVWAGTALGISVLALLVGCTGIGGPLAASPTARSALAVIGGCVLAVFGALTLRRELRRGRSRPRPDPRPARLLAWSFLALVTNVKALSLYVLIVPAIDADGGLDGLGLYLAFGAVHITMLLLWLLFVAYLIVQVPARHSDQVRSVLGVLGGLFMIALGVQSLLRA